MKKTRFTVLHPVGTNVDIFKDEGQIPYTLANMENIEAKLVSCHIKRKNFNPEDVQGLIVKHFPLIINNAITGVIYLLLNSKKIDWLNIYFAGRQAYIWMKIYKIINRKGHVFLKLDMDFRGCALYDLNVKERKIFKKNTKVADIVSVESTAVKNRIQKYSEKELLLIEDGISKFKDRLIVNQERENLFITVGRLGTYQKGTEILLEAFADSCKNHNWKLKLIGNIEDDFRKVIDKFYVDYPNMRERVIFTGPINDRTKLYSEYYHAKVFVLPSRWESFGIAAAEALSCGCHLILSDSIPPAEEMTNFGKFGEIIETENINSLSNAFFRASKKKYEQSEIDEIIDYANNKYSWERICKKLYFEMTKIEKIGASCIIKNTEDPKKEG